MARKPYISDYGGNSYGNSPRKTEMDKDNIHSFRCLDCNTLRYLAQRELTRAAIQHCLACGGPLEETTGSRTRHIEKNDAVRLAKEGGKIADHEPAVSVEKCKCKCCHSVWTDANALMFHITRSDRCMNEYMDLQNLVVIGEKPFLRATLHVFRIDKNEHDVTGITTAGRLETIKTFKSAKKAAEFLQELDDK